MFNILIPIIFLIPSCYYDYREQKIPNEITYTMFVAGIAYFLYTKRVHCMPELLSALSITVLLVLYIRKIIKLGTGDIKLMLACSVWLGKQAPYFVFFSLLAVIVYNLVLKAKNSLGGLITAAKMEMLYGYKEPSGSIPGAFFITAGFTVCLLYQIFL
jgi:Flp pilus assembly protein protease CpaA